MAERPFNVIYEVALPALAGIAMLIAYGEPSAQALYILGPT